VAPRACVRVYARVMVPSNLYIHTYIGLPTAVYMDCLPADTPWDVASATRRSSGVAPRACACVYARVLVPLVMYKHIYTPGGL